MSDIKASGMTYEAETTELKSEFNDDFDVTDDETEASHWPTDTYTHVVHVLDHLLSVSNALDRVFFIRI